ncbi:NADPH-dependent FMN reductase [Candidimonas nitroreducens]|uniref:ACP phosphodiesterase n=1 Tax=Candidimonas nitroreducens TaxID=683354 RepID=A0A225M251_9BURK|nr:NAD(P)H-dependent oxidoreductase [Candidimonas nitroreducens]OWT55196.1 ACP phosphodiesterase [Candidimonas nitroreducens]
MSKRIAVIVGSLRKDSINRKAARALVQLAPPSLSLELIDIGGLALYNQDFDLEPPSAAYAAYREQIRQADGVIFVTPEHNQSMPAAMKNAIDIASRPPGQNLWSGKPGAIISASPGLHGGFGASSHLRQSVMCLNVLCMAQPETYLSQAHKLFDEAGEPREDGRKYLTRFINAYADWVARLAA